MTETLFNRLHQECMEYISRIVCDGRDALPTFESLARKTLGETPEKDEDYIKMEKAFDDLCELSSDVEHTYRVKGRIEGLQTEARFLQLRDDFRNKVFA